MADLRALLAVPDEAINEALALTMGWRKRPAEWHDLLPWDGPNQACAGGPPHYTSDESPRSLLGGVETRIAEIGLGLTSLGDYSNAAWQFWWVEAGQGGMPNCKLGGLAYDVYMRMPARIRARAALYVLDPQAAERLMAEHKGEIAWLNK